MWRISFNDRVEITIMIDSYCICMNWINKIILNIGNSAHWLLASPVGSLHTTNIGYGHTRRVCWFCCIKILNLKFRCEISVDTTQSPTGLSRHQRASSLAKLDISSSPGLSSLLDTTNLPLMCLFSAVFRFPVVTLSLSSPRSSSPCSKSKQEAPDYDAPAGWPSQQLTTSSSSC